MWKFNLQTHYANRTRNTKKYKGKIVQNPKINCKIT